MTKIEPLSIDAVKHVAWRMRDSDRTEISAMMYKLAPDELAQHVIARCKHGFVVSKDEPIAVVAVNETWPGRYEVMMFATDKWLQVALSTTREIKNKLIPTMLKDGLKLGFCFVHAEHKSAWEWLQYLGFEEQCALPEWGKNGEEFKLMVWRQ